MTENIVVYEEGERIDFKCLVKMKKMRFVRKNMKIVVNPGMVEGLGEYS